MKFLVEESNNELVVYNSADSKLDYKKIDLSNCKEIGLHTGTLEACKSFNREYVNKIVIDLNKANIFKVERDLTDMWSSLELVRYLTFLNDEEKATLLKELRKHSGDTDKYKEYSKIYRKVILSHNYNVISYINEIEDEGSTSYIILDTDVIK